MSNDPNQSLLITNLCNGRFAFTTDKYDMFSLCFYSRVPGDMQGGRHEVFFSTKHGVEANLL